MALSAITARRRADAAWLRYASACRFAGTRDEQRAAFIRALKAERAAWRVEMVRGASVAPHVSSAA